MDDQYQQALARFEQLIERARATALSEPTAVTLATADADSGPSARIVLLRAFDERGFVFFTNSTSRKGQQLAANPRAALCFYWDPLGEQVRIEGTVEVASDKESDNYWKGRPRESQIGAWASLQSQPLPDRETLESRCRQFEQRFADRAVPRPEHWHGYRLVPLRIEFWKNRAARLHERLVYQRNDGQWTSRLLYP